MEGFEGFGWKILIKEKIINFIEGAKMLSSSAAALINECIHTSIDGSKNSNIVSPADSFLLELQENNLFIFQCKGCRKILADSSTLQKEISTNDIIVLTNTNSNTSTSRNNSNTCPIKVNSDLQTCLEDGTDEFGSTYHIIKCADCSHDLGKMYRTTSPLLDSLRGMFTINLSSISHYKIHTAAALPNQTFNISQTPLVKKTKNTTSEDESSSPSSSLEIAKLQKFSLFLYQRLCALEDFSKEISQRNAVEVHELEEKKKKSKSKHSGLSFSNIPPQLATQSFAENVTEESLVSIAPPPPPPPPPQQQKQQKQQKQTTFESSSQHASPFKKPVKAARKSDGSLAPGEYGPVRKVGRPRKIDLAAVQLAAAQSEGAGGPSSSAPHNNVTIRD